MATAVFADRDAARLPGGGDRPRRQRQPVDREPVVTDLRAVRHGAHEQGERRGLLHGTACDRLGIRPRLNLLAPSLLQLPQPDDVSGMDDPPGGIAREPPSSGRGSLDRLISAGGMAQGVGDPEYDRCPKPL